MGFKNYLNEEVITKTPNPYRTKIKISLKEYKDLINNCKLKRSKKDLVSHLVEMKGSIPVFCAESKKFFMVDLNNPKRARDIKTCEEKTLCGALLNSMLVKMNEAGKEEGVKALKEIKLGWDIPDIVYNV